MEENYIRKIPLVCVALLIIYYIIFHNVLWFRIGLIVNCLICIIIDILSLKNSSNQLSEKARVRETILLFVVVIIWTIIKIVKSISYYILLESVTSFLLCSVLNFQR